MIQLSELHRQILGTLFVWGHLTMDRLHEELAACHFDRGLSCTDLRIACYELQHLRLVTEDQPHWALAPATHEAFVAKFGEPPRLTHVH